MKKIIEPTVNYGQESFTDTEDILGRGILLVEDNLADQVLFDEYLSESILCNERVKVVEMVEDVINMPVNYLPSIIILDLSLPDSYGMETLRMVQGRFSTIPIVILTGMDNKELGLKAVSLGAEDYLVKGKMNSEVLERTITYARERYRLKMEMIRVNEKLKIYNERLKQFAFIVSHDLNAPITRVQGLINLLKISEEDERCFILDKVEEAHKELSIKIEKLINVLVIEKSSESQTDKIKLGDKIRETVKNIIPADEISEVNLAISDACTAEVRFNEELLNSVLQNLISNAFKYRNINRALDLSFNVTENAYYYILSITDNGSGMEINDDQSKVFRMFLRFNHEMPGHGIGLYLVKSIMESNNGYVEVESQLDKGTTFKLYFSKLYY